VLKVWRRLFVRNSGGAVRIPDLIGCRPCRGSFGASRNTTGQHWGWLSQALSLSTPSALNIHWSLVDRYTSAFHYLACNSSSTINVRVFPETNCPDLLLLCEAAGDLGFLEIAYRKCKVWKLFNARAMTRKRPSLIGLYIGF